MKTIYKFTFFSDVFHQAKDAPKDLVSFDNGMRVEIKVDKESKDFRRVFNWSRTNSSLVIGGSMLPSYTFSAKENDSFEIFYISGVSISPGEMESIDYGTKHDLICKCDDMVNSSHSISTYKQVSPLYIDISKLSKNKDIQSPLSNEIIISKKLKELLEKHHITGFKLGEIRKPKKISKNGDVLKSVSDVYVTSDDWFQLIPTETTSMAVPPTKFDYPYLNFFSSKTQSKFDQKCNLIIGIKCETFPHFDRTQFPQADIVKTTQLQISQFPYPYIIFSKRLYNILKENKIKGFECLPAFFNDNPSNKILNS